MRKVDALIAVVFCLVVGVSAGARAEDPAPTPAALNGLNPPADASGPLAQPAPTDAAALTASPPLALGHISRSTECRWSECLWQPGVFEADSAEKKGLTGTCEARARSLSELDLTHFATPLADTHDWVLTKPGPLIDQTLHLRDQSGCAAWPPGFERTASWDNAIGSICPIAAAALSAPGGSPATPALQSQRGALNKCLSALFLFRASIVGALHGEDPIETFQDTQTVAQVFESELYSENPRLDRLTGLLDRFLTVLPGDVPTLIRLASLDFAAWAKSPTAAGKAAIDRTVSRLELYTLKLDDLFRPELERAIADHSALGMRQWALKLTEAGLGDDTAPYFLGWSAYLDGDSRKAQRYLRDALAKPGDWRIEIRVGLKRLLSRDKDVAARAPFFGPSITDRLIVPIGVAAGTAAWAPGQPLLSGGADPVALYGNELAQHPDLPEIREAVAEMADPNGHVRTDLEDFLYSSAVAAIEGGQNTIANAALDELKSINPDNPSLPNLARALVLTDKLRTNSADVESALLLGQIWYQEKQYGAAALQMRELLAQHPENTRAQVSLRRFQDLHDWEDRLLAEIKANPISEKPLYRYACFLFREERWRDTERVLDKLSVIAPDSARVTLMRRKMQELIQIPDLAKRTAEVYAFLSTELRDPDLEFPRALAGEMLGY